MINLLDIRYVRLGTGNLDLAEGYARDVLGLELARNEAGGRYFRSDNRDHTLVYFEGDPRDHTVGFELRTPEPAVWNGKWVFVATSAGTEALLFKGGRLHPVWSNRTGGTSQL